MRLLVVWVCLLAIISAQEATEASPAVTPAVAAAVASEAAVPVTSSPASPAFDSASVLASLSTQKELLEQLRKQSQDVLSGLSKSADQASTVSAGVASLSTIPSSISALSTRLTQGITQIEHLVSDVKTVSSALSSQHALLTAIKDKPAASAPAVAPAADPQVLSSLEKISQQVAAASSSSSQSTQLTDIQTRLTAVENSLKAINSKLTTSTTDARLGAIEASLAKIIAEMEKPVDNFGLNKLWQSAKNASADFGTMVGSKAQQTWVWMSTGWGERLQYVVAYTKENAIPFAQKTAVSTWECIKTGSIKGWALAKEWSAAALVQVYKWRELLTKEVADRFSKMNWNPDHAIFVSTGVIALTGAISLVVGFLLLRFFLRLLCAPCCRGRPAPAENSGGAAKKKRKRNKKKSGTPFEAKDGEKSSDSADSATAGEEEGDDEDEQAGEQ